MKHLKYLFTALLMLCATAVAAHDFEVDGIYYNISSSANNAVEVTYRGTYSVDYSNEYTGSVVIPQSVTYSGTAYCVTSIGFNAFSGCKGLTNITIPNSVTSIEYAAFENCSGLTSITIPNSITSIGNYAFYGCTGLKEVHTSDLAAWYGIDFGKFYANPLYYAKNLYLNGELVTELVIPDDVNEIKNYTFKGCTGLTSITIPNSVTSIGEGAFEGCTGLTSIEIPSSVTSIGDDAFSGCSGLTSIIVDDNNTKYDSRENCNAIIETETNTLVLGCENTIIPNSVTSIEGSAFSDCSGLTSITIPNSVTSIGEWAFSGCTGLTSIEIPNSVTSIGEYAFYDCTGLTSITIPNSVTGIGSSAFEDCTGLTSITIPNSVTSIGNEAFNGCTSLKKLRIEDGEGTLSLGCNTYDSYRIGKGLFYDCPLETLYLGRNLSYNTGSNYGYSPFHNIKTLASVTIGNSVTSIGEWALSGCTGLTSIEIPNSVTSIGSDAFNGCTGLTSITIPNSVTSIEEYAFYDCSGLTAVHIGDLAAWCGIDFASANANPLYYAKNLYLNGELVTDLVIPDSVTSIEYAAFYNCTGLTSIEIPNSVTSIGGSAFYDCFGLTSVVIGNSVTSIGYDAFARCFGLKTVYNLSNLTFSKGSPGYGYVAFYADKVYNLPEGFIENDFVLGKVNGVNTLLTYLGNATELTLPANYKGENYIIDADVFKGNTTITGIEIPNSVTSIENDAFSGCTSLTTVHISDLAAWCGINLGSADANPLYYAKNLYLNGEKLTELIIPDGIVEIKDYTFYNCNNLTSVVISNSVTGIGASAFKGCNNIENLYIGNSVESIGDKAFAGCEKITEIKVALEKPIRGSADIFADAVYDNATLYIPNGTKSLYEKREPWNIFFDLVEIDFTGIEDVYDEVKGEDGKEKTIYDLQGRVVENPTSGIYIIDGKKIFVK